MHQGIEMIPIGIDELRVLSLAVRGDLIAQFIEAMRPAFAESGIQLQRRFPLPDQLFLLIQKRRDSRRPPFFFSVMQKAKPVNSTVSSSFILRRMNWPG